MKCFKFLCSTITAVLCFNVVAFAAPVYKDVSATHWAYDSISKISEKSILLGDTSGNFRPNGFIDKFETSKVLAKVLGYKQINFTNEEKSYYDRAYDKNKSILNQYSKAFSKWNTTTDKEVAYLLEKEVLTVDSLNQFIIKDSSNTEKIRALSREEVAVFLVKLMGKNSDAISNEYDASFKDDAKIALNNRPYVYFLKQLGVISGDTDNSFNPNGAVTRASLAVMLDKTIAIMDSDSDGSLQNSAGDINYNGPSLAIKIETITGTFDKILSNNFLQVVLSDGTNKIYKMTSTATITIDGYLKTPGDLKSGMSIVGIINNSEVTDLKASSITTSSTIEPTTNMQLSTLEGTISTYSDETVTKTVGISVRMLNPRGEISEEVKAYALSQDCKITKDNELISLSDLNEGDIVKASVSGAIVYSISIEEKERKITGILLEKRSVTEDSPVLVVEDSNKTKLELNVTPTTHISRKDLGEITWNALRIGDSLEIDAEYNDIISINALGVVSSVDGTIEEINITPNGTTLSLKSNGIVTKYEIIKDTVDVYSVRVGSKVRLHLDSSEIKSLSVLEDSSSTMFMTGYVVSVKERSFMFQGSNGIMSEPSEVFFDSATIFMDSITGSKVTKNFLNKNMKIYVVFNENTTNLADTVTVLSR